MKMRILKGQDAFPPLDCELVRLLASAVSGMGARGQRVVGRSGGGGATSFTKAGCTVTKGTRSAASPRAAPPRRPLGGRVGALLLEA
jgi:hypothetical protein